MQVVGASPEMLDPRRGRRTSTPPDCRHAPPRPRRRRRARAWRTNCRPQRRSGPSTSCSSTSRGNDLGRVCEPGTVEVTSLMAVERYSHVMHLVSHVVGNLRDGVTTTTPCAPISPHGTVTGAPKIRTMEIIAELEGEQRGGYGGCVGYFDLSGNCDTALAIRTIWMKDGHGLSAGGGRCCLRQHAGRGVPGIGQQGAGDDEAIDQAEINAAEMRIGSLGYG